MLSDKEKARVEDQLARRTNRRMAGKAALEDAEEGDIEAMTLQEKLSNPAYIAGDIDEYGRPIVDDVSDMQVPHPSLIGRKVPLKKKSNFEHNVNVVRLLSLMLVAVFAVGAPYFRPSELAPDLQQSVLLLKIYGENDEYIGHGSCFVVAEKDGWWYAVTAKHCVEDRQMIGWGPDGQMQYETRDVKWFKIDGNDAWIMRKDSDTDVALVRFKSDKTYFPLSLADPVQGEECKTVGWTGGAFLQFRGHVAGWGFECGKDKFYTVANTGLFPGCSGGVLLNEKNEVIGVTVAVPVYNGIWDTVGLYVPIKYVRALMAVIE